VYKFPAEAKSGPRFPETPPAARLSIIIDIRRPVNQPAAAQRGQFAGKCSVLAVSRRSF